ncbi:somatotropin-2 [Salmo salar]|uniref:Growth hormone 2 n=1 Tax=Salmo salar TaxID=8030 RepID=B2Z9Z2_SALSA|nr:somatotropin-2 [Salmo salar]AAA49558.1 growth hormone [Salmo salar]ACD37714.1 growth hormone 2 [Salmo salar]|eukprot:XP_014059912.1 PREDICTED: somatotropin-2 [Salmo salar]
MGQVFLLMPVLLVSCFLSQGAAMENQRLFNIAVNRVQHLHLLAQKMFNDFEGTLLSDERRQLNKIFLLDFCNSDSIVSPIDKQETQKSSVLKLLHISFRLIESWEYPSQTLAISNSLMVRNSNQISEKLSDLKVGINLLIKGSQDGVLSLDDNDSQHLPPYGNYYQNLGGDGNIRRNYELLACFKKDMHKVETYLTVAKCRKSLEANCTL